MSTVDGRERISTSRNDDRCVRSLEVAMKRHRGQPLPLEKKLQIVGELLQQRKEREALMASRAAARSDARRHNRPPSRCSVAQSTVQFNYCFHRQQQEEQNSGSQSKRTTTNKRNNERAKLCSTFTASCCFERNDNLMVDPSSSLD
jgi:hypothetical protein